MVRPAANRASRARKATAGTAITVAARPARTRAVTAPRPRRHPNSARPIPNRAAVTTRVTSKAVSSTAGRTTAQATTPSTPKASRPAGTAAPAGGYGEPAGQDYDWGQSAGQSAAPEYGQGGGYAGYEGGYGQGEYGSAGTAVTLQLDDGSGRTYQLRDGSNIVGRGQDAQFRLPDTGVSRRHLEIRWDGQVALLSDLNSTNGTTVNNAPVQEWQLADGDVIRLGHSEIVVRIH